jgi:hypothetical protein
LWAYIATNFAFGRGDTAFARIGSSDAANGVAVQPRTGRIVQSVIRLHP